MKHRLLKFSIILLLLFMCFHVYGQTNPPKKVEFGKGINYMAKDSTFKIKFNFRMQSLFIVEYDEIIEDYSSQFLIRRARMKFGGFALSPKLEYKIELGLSNRDISVDKEDGNTKGASRILMDAVLKWKFSKNWALWVGQTKLPGNRERLVSSGSLQFVDRSLLNGKGNIDRDAGLQLHGTLKAGKAIIEPAFAISQGEGRNITSQNFGGFDYTVHVNYLPLGKFTNKGDYVLSDLEREQSPKLAIGLTFNHNDRAVRQGGQLGSFVRDSLGNYVENSLNTVFVDLLFKYKGFSVLSEYGNKWGKNQISDVSKKFMTGDGFNAQAGYLFKNNIEIAFRYTSLRRDGDFSDVSDEDQYTLGISKYIVGHNLKIQSDFTRRSFPGDIHGKYQFRAQVEMQF